MQLRHVVDVADAIGAPAELRLTRPPPPMESGLVPFFWTGQIELATIARFMALWTRIAMNAVDDETRALAARRIGEWRLVAPDRHFERDQRRVDALLALPVVAAPEPESEPEPPYPASPYAGDDERVRHVLAVLATLPEDLAIVPKEAVSGGLQPAFPASVFAPGATIAAADPTAGPEPVVTPITSDGGVTPLLQQFGVTLSPGATNTGLMQRTPRPAGAPVIAIPESVQREFALPSPTPVPVPSPFGPSRSSEIVIRRDGSHAGGAHVAGRMTVRRVGRLGHLRSRLLTRETLFGGRAAIVLAIPATAICVYAALPMPQRVAVPKAPVALRVAVDGRSARPVPGLSVATVEYARPRRFRWWASLRTTPGIEIVDDTAASGSAHRLDRTDTNVRTRSAAVSVEGGRAFRSERARWTQSVEVGRYVGATLAGVDAKLTGDGVVIAVPIGSSSTPKRVTVVDGQRVATYVDLKRLLTSGESDAEHNFAFDDGTRTRMAMPADFRSIREHGPLGLDVVTIHPKSTLARHVEIPDASRAVGGTGGLAFALATYAALTGEDIAHGRRIIAAGEVLPDGSVIGIDHATPMGQAAHDAGADVFLVPQESFSDAGALAEGVKVVGVTSVAEALEYLKNA